MDASAAAATIGGSEVVKIKLLALLRIQSMIKLFAAK